MPKTKKTTINLEYGYQIEISETQLTLQQKVERSSRDKTKTYSGTDIVGYFSTSDKGVDQALNKAIRHYASQHGESGIKELRKRLDAFKDALLTPCDEIVQAVNKIRGQNVNTS